MMFVLDTCEICGCAVVVRTGEMKSVAEAAAFMDLSASRGMGVEWTETGAMERHLQWHRNRDELVITNIYRSRSWSDRLARRIAGISGPQREHTLGLIPAAFYRLAIRRDWGWAWHLAWMLDRAMP